MRDLVLRESNNENSINITKFLYFYKKILKYTYLLIVEKYIS